MRCGTDLTSIWYWVTSWVSKNANIRFWLLHTRRKNGNFVRLVVISAHYTGTSISNTRGNGANTLLVAPVLPIGPPPRGPSILSIPYISIRKLNCVDTSDEHRIYHWFRNINNLFSFIVSCENGKHFVTAWKWQPFHLVEMVKRGEFRVKSS